MKSIDIVQQRIINQQLAGTKFKSAKEVVSWMGAMQAQDYAMAKWAVGVRLPGSTDETVEQAINRGEIIRTHVMRPTWHLVSSKDVRWMLTLTAPHLRNAMKSTHKKMGLTDQLFKRTNFIIEKSLTENGCMTRGELVFELNKNKIKPNNLQTIHIMFNSELNGSVCNGPIRGKQFTYALLEERVPKTKTFTIDEALAELSLRYFKSHGPATLQDFAWWSGLPAADAKNSLEMVKSKLMSAKIGDQTYWFDDSIRNERAIQSIYFLPAYDEFMISYKDRSAALAPKFISNAITSNGIFRPIIVVNGQVVGTWSREIKKEKVVFESKFFRSLQKLNKTEMNTAFEPYKNFLGRK
jgi:Winged helix DNA-binding domain